MTVRASRSTAEALASAGVLPQKGATREKRTRAGGSRKTSLPGAIVKYLNGIPGVWACRVHSGKVRLHPDYGGYWMHLAPEGTPDVIVLLPGGKFCGIEAKERTGRARRAQTNMIDAINRAGGLSFVAKSVADVEKALKLEGIID